MDAIKRVLKRNPESLLEFTEPGGRDSSGGITSRRNKKLFNVWSKMDPVDEWECEKTRKIEKNQNTVVREACVEAGLL